MAEESVSREQLVFEAVTRQASSEIQTLRRDYRSATSGMSDDALKLVASQARLEAALSRHGAGSNQARNAELAFRQALTQTTYAAQKEAGVLDEATAAKTRFGSAGVYASRSAASLKTNVGGASIAFLGATGLVFALQAGIHSAVEFDRSMRNVNSIAHLSESQLSSLSDQVLQLSNVTGKGPKDLADGLYDIVSSGFKAADAVKILEASAKAATAGMTDTATSSKGVVAILNAYHLSADQARQVSDLLFQEVNLGVNTFGELAQNLGDTVPQAAALKIPFEQVAAALAAITKNGTPMAEASTQVSRVLTALIKPSKELQAEFHRMGFESGQAAVGQLGLVGVLQRLSADAAGNQQKIAAWLGEVRGIRGVLNLTGANLQSYTDLLAQMGQATEGVGATQRAFEEQQKSLGYQIDRTKANLQALASSQGGVGKALAGMATNAGDLTGSLVDLSQALSDLNRASGGFGGGFLKQLTSSPWGEMSAFVKLLKQGEPVHFGQMPSETLETLNNIKAIKQELASVPAAAAAWDAQFGLGALTTSGGLTKRPDEGTRGPTAPQPSTSTTKKSGNPDLDYRIALESATSDRERLSLLTQHRQYLNSRIASLESKTDLADWQKQQLLKLVQLRNQEETQIDQIIHKSDQDTAAKQASRERDQLAAEKRFEQSSPGLRNIIRAESRAASTKGKQDDVDQAQREVAFWKDRLEQLDRASGAYEHVADKLSTAEDRLARAQGKLSAVQTATSTTQLEAPRNLRIKQLQAALTDSDGDDLRVARAIEGYWARRLATTKKTAKVYEDILQQLVSAHDAVKGLEQQLNGSGPNSAGALQAEFLSSLQAIISANAPNYGTYGTAGLSPTQAYELVESNRETAAHMRAVANRRGADTAYDHVTSGF